MNRFQAPFFVFILAMLLTLAGFAPIYAAVQEDPFVKAINEGNQAFTAKDYTGAEAKYKAALALVDKRTDLLGQIDTAMVLSNLASIYTGENKYPEAEAAYKQSLKIQEKLVDQTHSYVSSTLQHYSSLLRLMDRGNEANQLAAEAQMLKVKSLSQLEDPVANIAAKVNGANSGKVTFSTPKSSGSNGGGNTSGGGNDPSNGGGNTAGLTPGVDPSVWGGGGGSQKGPIMEGTGVKTTIIQIVKMSQEDRALLRTPTTYSKPVFAQQWTGGAANPYLGITVGAQPAGQTFVGYETVPLDQRSDLSYVSTVAQLSNKYQLSSTDTREILRCINAGGSCVELGNYWLVITQDDLIDRFWSDGQNVTITASYESGPYYFTVTNADGSRAFMVKRMAMI